MSIILRILSKELLNSSNEYPVIVVTGPRQSGKTTLVRSTFPEKQYVLLEDLDQREYANTDPRRFLENYKTGAIIDEVQYAPHLLNYMQGVVDSNPAMGRYILTGSQHFQLMKQVHQSLAGRVALFTLQPFSLAEFDRTKGNVNQVMVEGAYPPVHDRGANSSRWFRNYIKTYLERDVKEILNVTDLSTFHRFLRICASNAGMLVNYSNLGRDCGISYNTAKAWISVLEASGIVFHLQPYHASFRKRIVKAPKLYFHDTGLLCSLLGIESADVLDSNRNRGEIFECFIISELMKLALNAGKEPQIYFWRDYANHEIDVLLEMKNTVIPIEIKSGATVTTSFFKGLQMWNQLNGQRGYLIYGGDNDQEREEGSLVSWRRIVDVFGPLFR